MMGVDWFISLENSCKPEIYLMLLGNNYGIILRNIKLSKYKNINLGREEERIFI